MHVATWPFYFILYLPYIAEYIISVIKPKIKKENKFTKLIDNKVIIERNDRIKWLIFIMFASLLTGLITPIKDTPYTYLIKTMIGNTQKYIREHQMLTLKDAPFTIVMTILTIFLAIFNKSKLRDLFMVAGLIFMSIISIRHMALLGLIGTLCFARTFDIFLDSYNQNAEERFNKIYSGKIGLISSVIIVGGLTAVGIFINVNREYTPKAFYPTKAVEYIKKELNSPDVRIMNNYNIGSYLIFHDIPVFIDSRADLYTKPFSGWDYDIFEDDCNMTELNYHEMFDFYKITHVIINQTEPLYFYFKDDSNMKVVYKDQYFAIFKIIRTEKITK
jgi:hypothetical protein